LELSELGAPFLDVTTNTFNKLLHDRNKHLLNNPNHYDPKIDGKIEAQLPELITITIVDSRVDKTTGETIITPQQERLYFNATRISCYSGSTRERYNSSNCS
jgi:hypothetical protein